VACLPGEGALSENRHRPGAQYATTSPAKYKLFTADNPAPAFLLIFGKQRIDMRQWFVVTPNSPGNNAIFI
jgi:hypothetical protein